MSSPGNNLPAQQFSNTVGLPREHELEIYGAVPGVELVVSSLEAADRALRFMKLSPEELERCLRVASELFFDGAHTIKLVAPKPPPEGPDITPFQRDLLFALLSDARDDVYRAAQELEATDPAREQLWALAGELDAVKVALGRRCRACS